MDRQQAQCPACGELIVVDWVLEHDQQRKEVRRLSTGCPACGIPLTPPG